MAAVVSVRPQKGAELPWYRYVASCSEKKAAASQNSSRTTLFLIAIVSRWRDTMQRGRRDSARLGKACLDWMQAYFKVSDQKRGNALFPSLNQCGAIASSLCFSRDSRPA